MTEYKNKTEREVDSLIKTKFSFSIPLKNPINYITAKLKKLFSNENNSTKNSR